MLYNHLCLQAGTTKFTRNQLWWKNRGEMNQEFSFRCNTKLAYHGTFLVILFSPVFRKKQVQAVKNPQQFCIHELS